MATNLEATPVGFLQVASVSLLVLMLAPLMGLFEVWPLHSALSTGLTVFSVGVFFGAALLARRGSNFHFNTGVFFAIAFIAALGFSVASGTYSIDATWRWYLVSFVTCAFALIAASELKAADPKKFYRSISFYLWVGCLTYGVLSILKYYGLLTLLLSLVEPSESRLAGVWGQSNLTTTMCWLGLLAGSVSHSPRKKHFWYISLFVFGWTLACAASRMSWLMVAGLLLLVLVSRLPRYRTEETKSSSYALFQGVVVIFAFLFVVPPVNQEIRESLVSIGMLEENKAEALVFRDAFQDSARLNELSKVLSEVEGFPLKEWLVGVGPGNYSTFSYQADMSSPPDGLVAGTWSHSHNLFTMVLVEFGLVGLTILVALFVVIAVVALRPPMNLSRFFSVGGIGLLFIHSNLEFPLWYPWFLILFCLLLTNLLDVHQYRGDSTWLKPSVGLFGLAMILALLVNTGSQYSSIVAVAMNSERDREDLQRLSILANDSLMGPYAILRKYRDFAPEASNIEWQLREARRMKAWEPKDLVVLREFSLLVLKRDVEQACVVAEQVAYRYPDSAPIMFDHSLLANVLSSNEVARLANCIEKGLVPRGETILSVQRINQSRMAN